MFHSVADAAGQVLVGGFAGKELPFDLSQALGRGEMGGVILFKRNLGTLEEVATLIRSIRAACRDREFAPWIAVDQEGGRVARLGPPLLRLPPMRALGDRDDADLTERAGRILGQSLATLGFNCNFAPVLDVDTNPQNPVIGDRAFSSDPHRVATHGIAFAKGLGSAGILACGKHFPGHGDTDLDSHLALPRLPHAMERLEEVELVPFRKAIGHVPTLMTAHVVFDAIDPSVPATLSRAVITDLLRTRMGYKGVIVSDDLEMKAVRDHWGIPDSALRAIDAGCDTLLVCSDMAALAETREHLTRTGERDSTFRAKLLRAATRNAELLRSIPAGAAPGRDFMEQIRSPEVVELEAELGTAGPPMA
ncbi:MAG: beta-N-acetylhexosaminidase [Myxococcales bacterium]|nr:beta-N-acetylhexosaminidase [Myxococcales bacterium]